MTILTKDNFENEVLNSDRLCVVDFWATWCGPCRMLSPILEQLDKEMPDVKFCKVNVDDEPGLADSFGVSAIPMLAFISEGSLAETLVGYRAKEEIVSVIEEYK